MFERFLNKADELLAKGEPFAIATVVRYEAPISGKPGDKAIIRTDGKLWGWIGGGVLLLLCRLQANIRQTPREICARGSTLTNSAWSRVSIETDMMKPTRLWPPIDCRKAHYRGDVIRTF
jgi:xanthine/CO dehydrogenase XdhC/CoxF family maturation factor